MYKFIKVVFSLLWWFFVFTILPAIAETTGNASVLFDMQCTLEKWTTLSSPVNVEQSVLYAFESGVAYQRTLSGDIQLETGAKNLWFFKTLMRRWYTQINSLESFTIGNDVFTITLGQKCWHPEVRINGREYKNDLWVFEVKKVDSNINLYYLEDDKLNTIVCSLGSFPVVPQQETGNLIEITWSVITGDVIQTPTIPPVIEYTNIHIPPEVKPLEGTVPEITQDSKTYHQLKNAPLYKMIKAWGYERKTDKAELANQAWIKNYKGTNLWPPIRFLSSR